MAFKDGIVDFRSDTVTRPTDAMYRAMVSAPLGDDVYGEDPTVNALEEECAELFGKDAGLFVSSGTQGNGLAVWTQTQPGDDVVCVQTAHVRNYEHGANSAIAGVGFRTIESTNGRMQPDQVHDSVQGAAYHLPRPGLLSWENTHNVSGGTVIPLDLMIASSNVARDFGLAIHLDGARIFNAVEASGVSAAQWGAVVDTVQFCFSKALGAPVGSMLVGPRDVIDEARHRRKMLGGGTRQVGVLAAAAKVGLDGRARLADDHALAAMLADGVADRFPDATDPGDVETNMVVVSEAGLPGDEGALEAALAAEGIRVATITPGRLRFVTHSDVEAKDVDRVLRINHVMRIGVLFPGQGAQFVGMGAEVFAARPDLLGDRSTGILGWSLLELCSEGPEEKLTLTEHAQPALYGVSYALWDMFSSTVSENVRVVAAAGHSLGEYTALAAAGVLSFDDGLRLVDQRGRAMGRAATEADSAMAALIGADEDKAEALVSSRRAEGGRLWVANLNAPGQVVVAGGAEDISWAQDHVKEFGMRRAIVLKVAGAFHTPFMATAVDTLSQAIETVDFSEPRFTVYANTTAAPYGSEVGPTLVEQVVGQVRFMDLLTAMSAEVDAFVHIGPGDVTAGMAKRTVPDIPVHIVNNEESLSGVLETLG